MVKIALVNKDKVIIELTNGKTVSVNTDDGTALTLAMKMMDWSEVHDRVDRAEEVTQEIDLNMVEGAAV